MNIVLDIQWWSCFKNKKKYFCVLNPSKCLKQLAHNGCSMHVYWLESFDGGSFLPSIAVYRVLCIVKVSAKFLGQKQERTRKLQFLWALKMLSELSAPCSSFYCAWGWKSTAVMTQVRAPTSHVLLACATAGRLNPWQTRSFCCTQLCWRPEHLTSCAW